METSKHIGICFDHIEYPQNFYVFEMLMGYVVLFKLNLTNFRETSYVVKRCLDSPLLLRVKWSHGKLEVLCVLSLVCLQFNVCFSVKPFERSEPVSIRQESLLETSSLQK